MDMNVMDNKVNHTMEDNNNTDKRSSSRYEDMTGSQGFDSLIPPEASYENTSRPSKIVELDDDGNEIGELPRIPSRVPSRYIRTSLPRQESETGSLVPSPGPEEEQICLSAGTTDDIDGGYLEPHHHLYEEIKEVKKTVEVTPSGSRIMTIEEKTTRIPRSIRRLTSRISRKPLSVDEDYVKCSCSKKMLLIAIAIILVILLLITVIVVAVILAKKPSESESERGKEQRSMFTLISTT